MLAVRSWDGDKRRKGRVLAFMLLMVEAALLGITVANLVGNDLQYMPTNAALLLLVLVMYLLNRSGYVLAASISTVVLAGSMPLFLAGESDAGVYLAMVVPVLIASSLLAPWTAFLVALVMVLFALVFDMASLAVVLFLLIAVFAYLFADNIDSAYRHTRYQSLHDLLTGLPNRALLEERIRQAMSRPSPEGGECAVLFLDLDGFKVVNDSLGHDCGDELLRTVGARLRAQSRSGDTVARLGGDEFAVLLDGAPDREEAERMADRILSELSRPVRLGGQTLEVNSSVGIAFCRDAPREPRALLRNADLAMYEAKKAGKGRASIYSASMHAEAFERLELENELRAGIDAGQLTLHYQPQVSLDNDRIIGFEALVRWEHPERGLMYPGDFVPLAEETGLILPLGLWVLEEAFEQAASWSQDGRICRPPHVGVNISGKQLRQTDIVQSLEALLESTGVEPGLLQIELTESTFTEDSENSARVLQAIRDLGIKIALDDFGTGYSSLAAIRKYPFDIMKVDRKFIVEVGEGDAVTDVQDASIVRLVSDLAHTFGMETTVEGVETAAQRNLLKEIGCDSAQGYYYSEPVTSGEAREILLDQETDRGRRYKLPGDSSSHPS